MAFSDGGERRRPGLTVRCAWCGCVKCGEHDWRAERRVPAPDATHSICPACVGRLDREAAGA